MLPEKTLHFHRFESSQGFEKPDQNCIKRTKPFSALMESPLHGSLELRSSKRKFISQNPVSQERAMVTLSGYRTHSGVE
jgi:hypothetical protein